MKTIQDQKRLKIYLTPSKLLSTRMNFSMKFSKIQTAQIAKLIIKEIKNLLQSYQILIIMILVILTHS